MSFTPFENPIGFGTSDVIEIAWAAVMVTLAVLWRPLIAPAATKLAERMAWSMLLLAALPVALRLLLLKHHPVPTPDIYDEFSHLLVADTLRHFRLANPPHALPQFFETFFVLQEPTYSSIYPIGQGLGAGHRMDAFRTRRGPECCWRWRRSARCATGCCADGPRRAGRSPEVYWR